MVGDFDLMYRKLQPHAQTRSVLPEGMSCSSEKGERGSLLQSPILSPVYAQGKPEGVTNAIQP